MPSIMRHVTRLRHHCLSSNGLIHLGIGPPEHSSSFNRALQLYRAASAGFRGGVDEVLFGLLDVRVYCARVGDDVPHLFLEYEEMQMEKEERGDGNH